MLPETENTVAERHRRQAAERSHLGRDGHRPRHWLAGTYALLFVASLVPLWFVRYQPLPDLAVHLAAGSIIHNIANPAFDFARYYQRSLDLNPYWGYYAPLQLLAFPFSIETANRLVLSLYVVALPTGTALLARRFDRSPWLGLFAFPILWNFNFTIGFISFAIGTAALPFALIAFDRFCEKPTPSRGLLASLLGIAMYFFHLLPWGMYLGAAGLIGLLHRGQTGRTLRAIAGRLFVWLPSLLVGAWVTWHAQGNKVSQIKTGVTWKHYPVWQSIGEMYKWTWDGCVGHEDEVLAFVLFVTWLALKLSSKRRPLSLHNLRPEACFAVAMGAYLILPRSVLTPIYWWGVNLRFACLAFLFAGLCIDGEFDLERGLRRFLLIPLALVGLGFAVDTTIHWRRAEQFAAGYDDLAKLPEQGSRVMFILAQPWHDPSARNNYVQTYYDIYQAQRGGYMPYNFDADFPMKYRQRFPAPPWRSMHFDWKQHAPYWDYVMAFQTSAPQMFPGHESEVRTVAKSGKWTLYKLPGPRIDVSPGPVYPGEWALDPNWRPPSIPRR